MKSREQVKHSKLSMSVEFNMVNDFKHNNITVPSYSDQNRQSSALNGEHLNDAMVLLNDLLIATAAFYPQPYAANNIALKLYR